MIFFGRIYLFMNSHGFNGFFQGINFILLGVFSHLGLKVKHKTTMVRFFWVVLEARKKAT